MTDPSLELRAVLRMMLHVESILDDVLDDPEPVMTTLQELQAQLSDEIIGLETGHPVQHPIQKDDRN